ncbi:MAG TPA: DUF3352 domain-containing protein, partial [Planctomycetota bacterium]|nr:DUF3352 domain-containing protein [Planctomycetota bacterium]
LDGDVDPKKPPAPPPQGPNAVTSFFNIMGEVAPGPFAVAVRFSPEDAKAKRQPAVAVLLGVATDANVEAYSNVGPAVLADLLKRMKVETLAVTEYGDAKLISVTVEDKGARKDVFTLTLLKGRLLVSTDAEFTKQILDGLSGKLPKRLSDNQTYKNTGLLGDEHLIAYLDVVGLKAALGAAPKPDPAVPNQLDDFFVLAGLNKSIAVAWSLKMRGPAFESRTAIFSEGEREGLLGTLDDAPLSPEAMHVCPPNTPLAAGFRIRPDKVSSFLRNVVKAVRGPKGLEEFNAMQQQINKELGKDIEQELRTHFGNEFVIASLPSDGTAALGQISAFVAALTVKDEKKADELLSQVLTRQAAKIDPKGNAANVLTELDFDGKKIRFLQLPAIAGIIELSPSFVITNNRLLVTMDVPTLKRAMKTLKEGAAGKSLHDAEIFKKALADTGGNMGPMFSYVDWAAVYKTGFQLSTTALRLVAPTDVLREIGINMNLVPSTDTVAQHLFPGLSVAQITPNGIVLTSRSPLPSLEVLSPPLAAVTAVFASFRPFMAPAEKK